MKWTYDTVKAFLRCPKCKSEIALQHGGWKCTACETTGLTDPFGIPTFVEDEAGTDDVFDSRWARHQKPQATDQFWKILAPESELAGKAVLDAGCGIGRYARRAVDAGAETVIAADMSPAALVGASRLVPEALLLRTDLLRLPVKEESVDFAFSIGVLHHTPDPAAAFAQVARTVKRGGLFAAWVYEKPRDPVVAAAMALLHDITRCCPKDDLHRALELHATRVRDLYSKNWAPLQQVLRVSISEDNEECISDTFDWHGPEYRFDHTEEEVCSWFTTNGFEVVRVGEHAVNVLGRKL